MHGISICLHVFMISCGLAWGSIIVLDGRTFAMACWRACWMAKCCMKLLSPSKRELNLCAIVKVLQNEENKMAFFRILDWCKVVSCGRLLVSEGDTVLVLYAFLWKGVLVWVCFFLHCSDVFLSGAWWSRLLEIRAWGLFSLWQLVDEHLQSDQFCDSSCRIVLKQGIRHRGVAV